MKKRHSPAPFTQMKQDNGEGGLVILSSDGGPPIGSAWSDGRPECLANARLFAASAELLEAVANATAVFALLDTSPSLLATPDGERILAVARMTARAAIDKATKPAGK